MKKSFLDWPLDGQIGLVACILAIILMITAGFLDIGRPNLAEKKNGYYRPKLLRSSCAYGTGGILIIGLIVYGVSQAGHCFNMTPQQNHNNVLFGLLLIAVALLGGAYGLYCGFLRHYAFNKEEFVAKGLFRETRYRFADLAAIGLNFGRPYAMFNTGKALSYPSGFTGQEQFNSIMESHLLSREHPAIPVYTDETAAQLIGKNVMVLILTLDDRNMSMLKNSLSGSFEVMTKDDIVIRIDDGTRFRLASTLRGIYPYDYEIPFAHGIPVPPDGRYDCVVLTYE